MSLVPLIKPAQCLGMPNEVSGEEGEARSILDCLTVGRELGATQQLAAPKWGRLAHTQGFLLLASKSLEPAAHVQTRVRPFYFGSHADVDVDGVDASGALHAFDAFDTCETGNLQ